MIIHLCKHRPAAPNIQSASIVKTGTRAQPVCRPRSSGQFWYQVQSNIIMRSRQTAAMAGYANVL